jgi:hypothetical protein
MTDFTCDFSTRHDFQVTEVTKVMKVTAGDVIHDVMHLEHVNERMSASQKLSSHLG